MITNSQATFGEGRSGHPYFRDVLDPPIMNPSPSHDVLRFSQLNMLEGISSEELFPRHPRRAAPELTRVAFLRGRLASDTYIGIAQLVLRGGAQEVGQLPCFACFACASQILLGASHLGSAVRVRALLAESKRCDSAATKLSENAHSCCVALSAITTLSNSVM